MNEYQDQATWYELWGHDGFQWEFIADFDTREEALEYSKEHDFGYDPVRTVRRTGLR